MGHDRFLAFDLPAVGGEKVTAAFDGGRLTSNAGVLLLREVERTFGIAERLAACLADARDPSRIDHTLAEMLRYRMFAIAAGYEDGDDCNVLRDLQDGGGTASRKRRSPVLATNHVAP